MPWRACSESGKDDIEWCFALDQRYWFFESLHHRGQFLPVQFPIVRRVDNNIRALSKKMLRDQVHGAVRGIPILDLLVGIGQDALANGIHFEVDEAELALKLGANCGFTGARRATENNQHVVILQPVLQWRCPVEEHHPVRQTSLE